MHIEPVLKLDKLHPVVSFFSPMVLLKALNNFDQPEVYAMQPIQNSIQLSLVPDPAGEGGLQGDFMIVFNIDQDTIEPIRRILRKLTRYGYSVG